MPPFLLGSLLILYFAFDLHLFPVSPPINSTALDHLHRPPGLRPAGDHALGHHHRLLQPLHALVHDGRPDPGLRPHGTGQGGEQQPRPLRPRPAQRAHPHPHPHRAVAPRHRQRRADHRNGVQLPGHGPVDRDRGRQRRHPDRARAPRWSSPSPPWPARSWPTSSTPSPIPASVSGAHHDDRTTRQRPTPTRGLRAPVACRRAESHLAGRDGRGARGRRVLVGRVAWAARSSRSSSRTSWPSSASS